MNFDSDSIFSDKQSNIIISTLEWKNYFKIKEIEPRLTKSKYQNVVRTVLFPTIHSQMLRLLQRSNHISHQFCF